MSKWERDIACPDINTLPKLAQELGVSVDTLLCSAPPVKKPNAAAQTIVSIALKTVAMGMGIAVTVTSALGELSVKDGLTMLGLGLACVDIHLFTKPE